MDDKGHRIPNEKNRIRRVKKDRIYNLETWSQKNRANTTYKELSCKKDLNLQTRLQSHVSHHISLHFKLSFAYLNFRIELPKIVGSSLFQNITYLYVRFIILNFVSGQV